jgi:H/ACA ribonucleoprotein complex non-core subunit NAF1
LKSFDEDDSSSSSSSSEDLEEELKRLVDEQHEEDEDGEEEEDAESGEEAVDKSATRKKQPVSKEAVGPLTKNEIPYGMAPLDPLPAQELLLPGDRIVKALTITAVQSDMVVASSLGSPVLDSGSVVCSESRVLIGRIDDVFGPVTSPFYTVRIMVSEQNRPLISVGDILCWVEKLSYLVNCAALDTRGTDASNLVDEELGDEEDEESGSSGDEVEFIQPDMTSSISTDQAITGGSGLRNESSNNHRGSRNQGRHPNNRGANRQRRGGNDRFRQPRQEHGTRQARGNANAFTPALQLGAPTTSPPASQHQQAPQTSSIPPPVNLPPGWPVPRLPAGWPAPRF